MSQDWLKTDLKLSAFSNTISQLNFYLSNERLFELSITIPFLSAKTLAGKHFLLTPGEKWPELKCQEHLKYLNWNIWGHQGSWAHLFSFIGFLGNGGSTLINFDVFLSTFSFFNCIWRRHVVFCELIMLRGLARGPATSFPFWQQM